MKKLAVLLLPLLLPGILAAQTGEEIIRQLDRNQVFQTQKFTSTMVIEKDGRRLVKQFRGYGRNEGSQSYMEYFNPEDRGVKYLKKGKELWIFFPDADDIMKISGHMLRQGMMGSDISYEDMMEEETLVDKYDIELTGEQTVAGVLCYVVDLKAKVPNVTYARQVVYVDKARYVAVQIDMYAKGGRLIKKMVQSGFATARGRWYPTVMVIQDMRRNDSRTIVTFDEIQFDIPIPANTFDRQNLRR